MASCHCDLAKCPCPTWCAEHRKCWGTTTVQPGSLPPAEPEPPRVVLTDAPAPQAEPARPLDYGRYQQAVEHKPLPTATAEDGGVPPEANTEWTYSRASPRPASSAAWTTPDHDALTARYRERAERAEARAEALNAKCDLLEAANLEWAESDGHDAVVALRRERDEARALLERCDRIIRGSMSVHRLDTFGDDTIIADLNEYESRRRITKRGAE